MLELVKAVGPYLAAIITAAGLWDIARRKDRTKAMREDRSDDGAVVQAARVDERDRCAERIAELRTDIARLSGRIDEQGAELTKMRGRSERSDRRTLVAEGRAMAMKSIAEAAGADQATIDMIWERHDPDTIAGRMAT